MHRLHTGTDPAVIISSMTYSHQVTIPVVYVLYYCVLFSVVPCGPYITVVWGVLLYLSVSHVLYVRKLLSVNRMPFTNFLPANYLLLESVLAIRACRYMYSRLSLLPLFLPYQNYSNITPINSET